MSESTGVEKLCRLCGSESGIKINIFEPDSEHVMKIHKLLPITVNEHDPLPKHMCHRCTFKVNEFYDFRMICLKTQEFLKSKIPWLQCNVTRPEAVFVEEPMVQVNMNPLNIPLVDTKENLKIDPLAIEDDCLEVESTLEPEIVTYSMPSHGSNITTNENNVGNVNENQKVLVSPNNVSRKAEKRKPVKRNKKSVKNQLSKIWKTTRRKRKPKKRKLTHVDSENESDFVFSPSDILPEISTVFSVQSNNTKIDTNERHSNTEEGPESGDVNKLESEDNKLPPNILVTNIPRVGFVYTCENCARTFLASDSASRHVCETVPVEIGNKPTTGTGTDDKETTSDSGVYQCDDNDITVHKSSRLESLRQQPSEPSTPFHCDICDKKFRTERQFNIHLGQHFSGDSSPERVSEIESSSSWYSDGYE